MYSNPRTSGSNAASMANCVLCFKEFNGEKYPGNPSKLYDLCCKYLHSAFTRDNPVNQFSNQGQLFCPKCFYSGMQLIAFSDQMEFVQKSLSDFVVMFTLEILHRRGKNDTTNNSSSNKQLTEIDVSALPKSDSWSTPVSTNNAINIPSSSTADLIDEPIAENINIDQRVDPLLTNDGTGDETVSNHVEIKNENCDNDSNWIDESELMTTSNTTMPTPNEETSRSVSMGPTTSQNQTPVIKLKRMKLLNSSRKIVVEGNIDSGSVKSPDNEKEKNKKIILTRSGSRSSYKLNKSDEKRTEESYNFPSSSNTSKSNPKASNSSISERGQKFDVKRRQLSVHKRNQKTSLGNFKCDICNKVFKERRTLLNHKKLHAGETPFKCTFCSTSYTSRSCLRFHHLSHHTKEKPFKCQFCGKGFVQKWILQRHLIVHTGVGKFQCDQCEYNTAQTHLLKLHKVKKHSVANAIKC